MSTRIDKTTEAAGESLPPYSEAPPYTEAAEPEEAAPSSGRSVPPPPPPDYRQASFTPYVPIPTTLHGVSKTAYRGLHLCADADADGEAKKLFYVVHHTGMSGTGPLGGRLGVYIHNGLDAKAPVLAAAGQRLQHESLRERTSVVILPPHMPTADPGCSSSSSSSSSKNVVGIASHTDVLMEPSDADTQGPVFRLKLDIGAGPADKLRTAKFAWCRLGGDGAGDGGNEYTLLRKVFRHGEMYVAAGASRCAFPKTGEEERLAAEEDAGEGLAENDGEVVAVLTCGGGRRGKRLFTIEMRGSAAQGLLGERCAVMIVTTAVRIYQMHGQGMTGSKFLGLVGKQEDKKKKKKTSWQATGTVRQAADVVGLLSVLQ